MKKLLIIVLLILSNNVFAFNIIGIQGGQNYYVYNNFYFTILQLTNDKYLCFDKPFPIYDTTNSDVKNMNILWDWVRENDKCKKINFDLFFSGEFNRKEIAQQVSHLNDIIKEKKVDLLLTFGIIVSRINYDIPKISFGVIDPFSSKLLNSGQTKYNNTGIIYIENLHIKQMTFFYEKFKFKHIGLLFENTTNGKINSGFHHYKDYLLNKNITISICHTKAALSSPDKIEWENSILTCIDELIKNKVEAIYLTFQTGYSKELFEKISVKLNKHKIKSLYQLGELGVQNGILVSYYPKNYNEKVGYLYAKLIEKLVSGIKLEDISIDVTFEEFVECYNTQTAKVFNLIINTDCLY